MNFEEMLADKVFEQLGPKFIDEIIEKLDTKKISEAVSKSLIASAKEVYWTDILNDIMSDNRVTKLLADKVLAALKQ